MPDAPKAMHFLPVWLLTILLTASYFTGYTPMLLSVWLLCLSIITVAVYAKDKFAASKQGWRVPEKTLHGLALLGGWPGAIVAQQWLRHKTQKRSFRHGFWLTVAGNMAMFAALHSSPGQQLLQRSLHDLTQLQRRVLPDYEYRWLIEMLLALA